MPGPKPKNPKTRQRRNKEPTAAQLIETNPLQSGDHPKLPGEGWLPEVVQWWTDVWDSPMATEYTQADVHGLHLLASLLQQYWMEPDPKIAGEIRLQRQCFGLTPIDRRRLQWEIKRVTEDDGKSKPPKKPSDKSDPRHNLRAVK